MSRQEMQGFLPDDYIERRMQMRTNILWAVIFIIVAGGIGGAFFIAEKKVKEAETRNRLVSEEFTAAAKPIEQFAKVQEEQQRLNKQVELAHSLVENVNRSNILGELTNALPKGVYLVDFNLDARRAADNSPAVTSFQRAQAAKASGLTAAKPIVYEVTMRVKGLAYTDSQIDDYMKALDRIPYFADGVKFLSTEETTYKERKLRSFELEIRLDPEADSHNIPAKADAQQ